MKIKKEKIFGFLHQKLNEFGLLFKKNRWMLTVVMFLVVLAISLWVWYDCFYSPHPSQETINSFSSKKEDFGVLSRNIENVIKTLKVKEEKFHNLPDFSNEPELFKKEEDEKIVNTPVKTAVPKQKTTAENETKSVQ